MNTFKTRLTAAIFLTTLMSLPVRAETLSNSFNYENLAQSLPVEKTEAPSPGTVGCWALGALAIGSWGIFAASRSIVTAAAIPNSLLGYFTFCQMSIGEASEIVVQVKAGQVDDPNFQSLQGKIGSSNALTTLEMRAAGEPLEKIYEAYERFKRGDQSL